MNVITKICKQCGREKTQTSTRRWRCKLCDNAYQRNHYATHHDVMRKRKREHMAKSRTSPETREKYLGYQRKAYQNGGAEKQRLRLSAMKADDPWRWKSRTLGVKGVITGSELKVIFDSQYGRCGLTGRYLDFDDMELDHILPRSRGGDNSLGNLRWVCKDANQAKRNLTDSEFFSLCEQVAEWIGRRIMAADASYPDLTP